MCLLFPFGVACKADTSLDGPLPQPTKEPPQGFTIDTGKLRALKESGSEALFSVEQLATLRAKLPVLKGAKIIKPLRTVPKSRLAQYVICNPGPVEETTSKLTSALRAANWQEVSIHTPKHSPGRRTLVGNGAGFRLQGLVLQGDYQDCPQKAGDTQITLTFHELKEGSLNVTPPQPPPQNTLVPANRVLRDAKPR